MSKEELSPRRKIALVLLVVFVLSYPFVWLERAREKKEFRARVYIEKYRGEEPTNDPWGNKYEVKKVETNTGLKVFIRSAGPDCNFGTEDDIKGGYHKQIAVEIIEN